jgi:L-Lysine epsilon oxidase N-terminal/L-lysine epsilon oxidase C-terminal domain
MPLSFEIHPTIGIARLGASDGFFIGPEPDEPPPSSYRDAGGILRQAARFRIFGVERNAEGTILTATEVTPATADIEWTVHLANRKATGVRISTPSARRNQATGIDEVDDPLIIDSGPRSISAEVTTAIFDSGSFRGTPVPLGEIRFETRTGRLLVLGGRGQSGFVPPGDAGLAHFADNDGWFDDTAEGPVTATVKLKTTGQTPAVSGARVVVGPPDYAPAIQNFVTAYDIVYQMALDKGLLPTPRTFSFMRFVHPVLMRGSGYQWVNAAGAARHGAPPMDFAASIDLLADRERSVGLRQRIFRRLRDPRSSVNPSTAMPRLFDDEGYAEKQFRPLALTPVQYGALARWGTVPETPPDFAWDSPEDPWATQSLPDALDRVALEACAGGAFFPGIELPRFIADPKNYAPTLPVRLRDDLAAGVVNEASAVPWQADFYDCQWEGARDKQTRIEFFEDGVRDYGWWPAQRPDSVYTDKLLQHRVRWAAGIGSRSSMVTRWKSLGFVLRSSTAEGKAIYIQTKPLPKKPIKKTPIKKTPGA